MFSWLKQIANVAIPLLTRPSSSSPLQKTDLRKDLHANLSDLAYKSPDEADALSRNFGYKVDRENTNPNATTFVNDNGEAIISYRGTNPSNADDLAADAHILRGSRSHKRFADAEELARRVKAKYKNVQATGHSLGGTQALHVNKKLGVDAHVFNPGATLGDTVDNDNVRVVRHNDDLISKALNVRRGANVKIGGTRTYDALSFLKQAFRAHSIF